MGSIADLIIAQGNQAARAREQQGAVWSHAVDNLSQIPEQIQHGQIQRQQLAMQQQELQTRIAGQKQQQQMGDLQLQQAQQGATDRANVQAIWKDPEAFNPDGTVNRAGILKKASAGGNGHLIPALNDTMDHMAASEEGIAKRAQDLETAHNDALGGDAQALAKSGYDPGTFHLLLANRAKPGPYNTQPIISPDDATKYMQLTDPADIKRVADTWIAKSPKAQAEEKSQDKPIVAPAGSTVTSERLLNAPAASAAAPGAVTTTDGRPVANAPPPRTLLQVPANPSVAGLDDQQEQRLLRQANGTATPQDLQKIKAYQDRKHDPESVAATRAMQASTLASQAMARQLTAVNLGNATDKRDLLTRPDEENATAKAIAEYRVPMPPMPRGGPTPQYNAQFEAVLRMNPDYRAEMFSKRAPMAKNFTSGPQSQTINSLNTAIVHLDQFGEMAKALNNGSFQPGNSVYNSVKTMFGDSAPTNFEGMKTIMSGELASAFKKSGATDQEIASVQRAIAANQSPKQMSDYITKVAIPALGGKISTFDEQYKATMGENDPFKVVLPRAQAVLDKYSHAGPTKGPAEGQEGSVGGVAAVWKTVNGKSGWYAK